MRSRTCHARIFFQTVGIAVLGPLLGLAPGAVHAAEPKIPPTASPQARSQLPSFPEIVQANREAVVNISTTKEVEGAGPKLPERFKGTPMEPFFRRFFGDPGREKRKVHSLGSGFIVSSDGHIVTNAHVVKKATEIVVQLSDRRQLKAEVVGQDVATDLALLKVDASGLSTVDWSEREPPAVGEWVLAMGSPFGFEQSVTAGIVSAKGRSIPGKAGTYVPFLQTDVALNPGSSGGPLFNLKGKVVGVSAQIYSHSGGYMGLSFAIPSGVARDVIAELRSEGEVRHGYLGVSVQGMHRELAQSLGLETPRGGLIAEVQPNTPAAKAGLQPGDVILKVNDQAVSTAGDLPILIGGKDPGTTVTLTLLRNEERLEKAVTLGALEEARGQATEEAELPSTVLGMKLVPVPEGMRRQRSLPQNGGALVKALKEGPARAAGIRPGDVLLKLANVRIKGPEQVPKILAELESGARVPVLIQRQERTRFLALTIP